MVYLILVCHFDEDFDTVICYRHGAAVKDVVFHFRDQSTKTGFGISVQTLMIVLIIIRVVGSISMDGHILMAATFSEPSFDLGVSQSYSLFCFLQILCWYNSFGPYCNSLLGKAIAPKGQYDVQWRIEGIQIFEFASFHCFIENQKSKALAKDVH